MTLGGESSGSQRTGGDAGDSTGELHDYPVARKMTKCVDGGWSCSRNQVNQTSFVHGAKGAGAMGVTVQAKGWEDIGRGSRDRNLAVLLAYTLLQRPIVSRGFCQGRSLGKTNAARCCGRWDRCRGCVSLAVLCGYSSRDMWRRSTQSHQSVKASKISRASGTRLFGIKRPVVACSWIMFRGRCADIVPCFALPHMDETLKATQATCRCRTSHVCFRDSCRETSV